MNNSTFSNKNYRSTWMLTWIPFFHYSNYHTEERLPSVFHLAIPYIGMMSKLIESLKRNKGTFKSKKGFQVFSMYMYLLYSLHKFNLPDKTPTLLGLKIEGLLQHNHGCDPRNEDSHLLLKDCLNASAPIMIKIETLNSFLFNTLD